MPLPDAELLLTALSRELSPLLSQGAALIGIHSGGVWLAERIRDEHGQKIDFGTLDISFYRDDFSRIGLHPQVKPSTIPFEVEGRHIILVDDVLFTGRTTRAAMNVLFDYGRPASITLAVLVDRGGRELPIAAQIVGHAIDLPNTQNIELTREPNGRFLLKQVSLA